jgi:hypothetical protein
MGYFLLGVIVFALTAPREPLKAAARHLLAATAVAVLVVLPNLLWNARHGWATVGHTAANANWGQGAGLHLVETASFAAAQIGVFGPILFLALALRVALIRKDPPLQAERFLLAFSVPVLVLMTLQSGISRAHANWAAVSYVSATILVVGWLDRTRRFWVVQLSLFLQLAVFAAFTTYFAGALNVRLPKTADIFHQMRGWRSLSHLVLHRLDTEPEGSSVAADDREVMAELDYYLRGRAFPLVMATGNGPPGNQYELENPITAANGGHVLLIARFSDRQDILDKFVDHKMTDAWTVSAGEGRRRSYFVYELSGFKGD